MGGQARCGSTCRSTCRAPSVDPDALRASIRADAAPEAGRPPTSPPPAPSIVERLRRAKRPVVLLGAGVRIAQAREHVLELLARLPIPVVTAWNSHDLIANDHPTYAGRPGSLGDRAGNFAVQNADFLLVLGCRLNIRQVSYAWQHFARNAEVAMIDIDAAELKKPTLRLALPVHADLRAAMPALLDALPSRADPRHARWVAWCRERVARYDTVLPEYWQAKGAINPYCFPRVLFDELAPDDAVVTGDGTACVTTFQAARIRGEQRLYTNSGCASMGYDLPGAIGACLARGGKRTICLAGDGSIQMNLQELQTIVGLRLPIKIFVLNNDGYHSIRQTQHAYFADNLVGFDPSNGVTLPDFERLAFAYRLPYARVSDVPSLTTAIRAQLAAEGPTMIEVMLDPVQPFMPRVASKKLPDGRMVSAPLEDLSPFLSRDELAQNMLAPILTDF